MLVLLFTGTVVMISMVEPCHVLGHAFKIAEHATAKPKDDSKQQRTPFTTTFVTVWGRTNGTCTWEARTYPCFLCSSKSRRLQHAAREGSRIALKKRAAHLGTSADKDANGIDRTSKPLATEES